MSRIPLLLVLSLAAFSQPVRGAEYERNGAWVFESRAFAEAGDATLDDCIASTGSADGAALSLRLEPADGDGLAARLSLEHAAWALEPGPVRLRVDIGAARWMLAGQGEGTTVAVDWTGDPALVAFLEDLASSSFAGVVGRGGATVAQFSLKGSRGAIEAMKACVERQIGQGLGETFTAGSDSGAPF